MLRTIISSTLLLLVLFTSCKKSDDPTVTNSVQTVTSSDINVKNYQVVTLLVKNGAIGNAKYTATFGVSAVELYKGSDSTLSTVVPAGISGAQDLVFSLNGQNHSLHYVVQAHTSAQTPDQVITTYSNYLQAYVNGMTAAEGKAQTQDSLNLFLSNVTTMSAAKKQIVAGLIEVNDSMFTSMISTLDQITSEDPSPFQKTNGLTCGYTEFTDKAVCMIARHHTGLRLLLGTASLAVAAYYLAPELLPIIAVGGLIAVKLLKYSFDDIETMLADLKDLAIDPIFTSRTQALNYVSGSAVSLPFKVTRANLQYINYNFIPYRNNTQFYSELTSYIADKFWGFISGPSYPALIEKDVYAEQLGYIKVVVLNNSNVTATISGTRLAPMLKFTSTASTNQTFSFTLSYNDGKLSRSKTFTGAVVAPAPTSVPYYYQVPPQPGYVQDDLGTLGCCHNVRRYYLLNLQGSVSGSTITINNFSAHDSTLFLQVPQVPACTPACNNPGTRYILGSPGTAAQATINASNYFTMTFNSSNYVTPVTITGTVGATQITGTATFNGKTISYTMNK